jgi:hypothetical protein
MSTEIKISLPFNVLESRVADKVFQVNMEKVPNASLVKLMEYAVQRLINDRAKGDTNTEKHVSAAKVVASILDGTCADSSRGPSVDIPTKARRNVVEAMIKALNKQSILKGLKAEARNAALDSIAKKNADKESFNKAVATEEKRLRNHGLTIDAGDIDL